MDERLAVANAILQKKTGLRAEKKAEKIIRYLTTSTTTRSRAPKTNFRFLARLQQLLEKELSLI